jgi:DNA-directed RNA polymerase subunit RPC12/RpoP
MKKCPHCGSKNLEAEDASNHDFQIVYCLDCDAAFEMDRKGGRKSSERSVDTDPEDELWQDDDTSDEAEESIDFDEER